MYSPHATNFNNFSSMLVEYRGDVFSIGMSSSVAVHALYLILLLQVEMMGTTLCRISLRCVS